MDGSATIESDRTEFFRLIFNESLSPESLIDGYLGYHGPIFGDQRSHFAARLQQFLTARNSGMRALDLIREDGALDIERLLDAFPAVAGRYFEQATPVIEAIEILGCCPNNLFSKSLPQPINQRSGREVRPAFSAFRVMDGRHLLVGPHTYQLFDSASRRMYPAVSSRSLPTSVERYEVINITSQLVLIQDYGDGGNFAHFVFDWVTRVMHVLDERLVSRSDVIFVMGGSPNHLQSLMVEALCSWYGLVAENFFFPQRRVVFKFTKPLIAFSDQKSVPMHPAQMAHPSSMRKLRELCKLVEVPPSIHSRVYISRQDAKLRRVSNETSLIEIARSRDFHVISMSDYSVEQQIALVKNAEIVVGPHGMGLTHMIFRQGPLRMLELFHPTLGTDAYAMIGKAMGFDHNFLLGSDDCDGRASYSIDPAKFTEALDFVCV